MAEFQTVIKQFKRLCNSADRDCRKCGLNDINCSIADIVNNSIEFEKRVMLWAAEHPEPVYPTWAEYLTSIGVYPKGWKMYQMPLKSEIPTDIAQKLGLEPKEKY